MNRLGTTFLAGAIGAAELVEGTGCRAGNVSLSGSDSGYADEAGGGSSSNSYNPTADECADKFLSGEMDLSNQVHAVEQVSSRDATLSSENQFYDQFRLTRMEYQDSLRAIAALGSDDRDQFPLQSYYGDVDTQSDSNEYGESGYSTESRIMDVDVDMSNMTNLDGYDLTVVFTNLDCDTEMGEPSYYSFRDYGYESGDYYVEE